MEDIMATIEEQFCMMEDWSKEDNEDGICMHCGAKAEEGRVCDSCYSKYSPGMLAELEG